MKRVPFDGCQKLTARNRASKVDQIIGANLRKKPNPLSSHSGDKVTGQTVLVGAVPSPRFCRPGSDQVILPVWAAQALEQLEKGLRLAGLMHPGEFLLQSDESATCFRVESGDRSIYRRSVASDNFWNGVHEAGPFSGAKAKVWGDVQSPRVTEAAPAAEVKRGRKAPRALPLIAKRGLDK